MIIGFAESKSEIESCFACISLLRPHLSVQDFMKSVERMSKTLGYQLAYLDNGGIKAVAGIRISEWLHTGKYLEIEELVTLPNERSSGYGSELFDWVCDYAHSQQCNQVRLVSGVKRTDAHRFYERKGMRHEAKYFSIDVSSHS